ncbi:MAG: HAMP domain-containing protein [Roseofilum sp. SBFL]|uniref:sensor histidine kinase n=1 Tax=unclassified Roseofilum TaxID=2620099 RepID=UPI001B07E5E1|nr:MULTISPECIES: ATP-binding protein [unclassified Roseofilum]MBP0015443.1 HAMP domain-containing protein [Roseofilum sp. SID3]MBP0023854.1 HAMP domain-containing protein [Roseofilum sp. SID2]MBP0039713.1 HAMP domain-containing protein [Roseofilum sp. SID1]MBP0044933.1 HAMP domain-containing protein [Roseofilum sp. SBFL]
MKQWLNHWQVSSIFRKIGYANFLVVSISISGTFIGFLIGDYYEEQAQKSLTKAIQQEELLHNLETYIFKIQSHPYKLISTVEEALWFSYKIQQFEEDIDYIEGLVSELNQLGDLSGSAAQSIDRFCEQAQTVIDNYAERFEEILPQVDPLRLSPDKRGNAQQQVLLAVLEKESQEIDIQFERLSNQLNRLLQISEDYQEKASLQTKQAKKIRKVVIFFSLTVSTSMAFILAFYTGRKIASPIEVVTQTAQKVTAESNYDLEAPVLTNDEVGILANALNQLIQKVKKQLYELSEAQSFLENRVEERTHELKETLDTLKETQAQLIQTEKMSSLGEMVAGVAHEINNPVSFIYGNISHAQEYLDNFLDLLSLYQELYPDVRAEITEKMEEIDFEYIQSDFPKILDSMRMGTNRIQSIVSSLRNFSRLDESEVKDVNLHEGLDSTLIILGNKLKLGVEIITTYGELPDITCYPSQLNQVFLNLIVNAIDALLSSEIEPKQIAISTDRINPDKIQVKIQDNGPGIPEEIRHKIFNPFFTTKPIGKGTGLGLAISYRIIEKHQGKIEVFSAMGKGTTFEITLPIELVQA